MKKLNSVLLYATMLLCFSGGLVMAQTNATNTNITPKEQQDSNALSEDDRKAVQEIMDFLNKLAPKVKREIAEYRKAYQALLDESQALYESLSSKAREALAVEREKRQKLSEAAKKELQKYLKELN